MLVTYIYVHICMHMYAHIHVVMCFAEGSVLARDMEQANIFCDDQRYGASKSRAGNVHIYMCVCVCVY